MAGPDDDGADADGAADRRRGTGRPRSPGIAASFRAAATDFYYQSIRLVPANVAWGLTLLAWLAFGLGAGPLIALITAPLLAVPYVAIARLAVLTARGRDVVLSDAVDAIRRFGLVALVAGALSALGFAILASNVIVGANLEGPVGWVLSTLAAAGLIGLWVYGVPFWVLLVDPDRDGQSVRAKARLAALLTAAAPGRLSWLAFLLFLVLVVSTIAIVALLTIAPAYSLLVASRYTLPLSDRLEDWLAAHGRAIGPGRRGDAAG
ncbi:MAG TPA: hypothetical protein VFV72_07005 [Candidatus Limnocylindrales bacterium]|nr:hypothetical protein [Candidatus Limnocylindrales bacterium]